MFFFIVDLIVSFDFFRSLIELYLIKIQLVKAFFIQNLFFFCFAFRLLSVVSLKNSLSGVFIFFLID